MGKWAKYSKQFKTEWLNLPQFKGWLVSGESVNTAYCKACHTDLQPHKTDLERHFKTALHQRNINKYKAATDQRTLDSNITSAKTLNSEIKRTEITLAAYIATHASIKSIDHLSLLLKKLIGTDKTKCRLEDIKLHRTKCTMIIKNILSDTFKEDLRQDIGDGGFSLIIDESTDVSIIKYICLCIRYFSKIKLKVVTTFLGLIEIQRATADVLSELIITFLNKIGLNVEKIVGLGTDRANNLCGKNHSVYTILKDRALHLQLVKCVAHSLHLCAVKSFEILPGSLEYLCRQIHNWFSNSALRRDSYKNHFELINLNENRKMHQFLQFSQTRWLSRTNVIKVILDQWVELKSHFSIIINTEKTYIARTLHKMLSDDQIYLYLTVVHSILINVNSVNIIFQHENADIFKVHFELYDLLLRCMRLIIKPIFIETILVISSSTFSKACDILNNDLAYLPITVVDFGFKYRQVLSECKLSNDQIAVIKTRCKEFVKQLCFEICDRLPENITIFDKIKYFSVENCLKLVERPKFEMLPMELLSNKVDKNELELQWNNIINVQWHNPHNSNNITSEEFWCTVFNYTNAVGDYIFRPLSEFALLALSLPISNATVERVFSTMNIIKNKLRNKIDFPLLDALIRIRYHFFVNNLCCESFQPSKKMLDRFTVHMYDFKNTDKSNTLSEESTNTIYNLLEEDVFLF